MTAIEVGKVPDDLVPVAGPTLYQKLLKAAREIDVVEKDKRNSFHKYDYSSIEAVAAATRAVLLEHGILLFAGQEAITDRQRQTREGEATVTTIELTFRFVDVETGEALSIPWVGRGEDPADKGVSKALTDARKTFLIQQLNLIRGDDTEADEGTDQRSHGNGNQSGGNQPGAVNMSDDARGLTNAQLNAALVSVGLAAQEKPWGMFTRVPPAHVQPLRDALKRERANTR
jgi:hypothetical protein